MRRHCSRFSFACAIALALWCALLRTARAYEDQAQVDLALGFAGVVDAPGLPGRAATLDVGGSYGLGDLFMLRGALGYGLARESGQTVSMGRGRLSLVYIVDVLRIVPFFGVGAGAALHDADGLTITPHFFGTLGLDYLVDRTWTVGADGRTGIFLIAGEPYASIEAQLRLSRVFDLF